MHTCYSVDVVNAIKQTPVHVTMKFYKICDSFHFMCMYPYKLVHIFTIYFNPNFMDNVGNLTPEQL